MRKITYNGEEGIFYPKEEFSKLQEKILNQNNLIQELLKEVKE